MEIYYKVKVLIHYDFGDKVKKINEEYIVKSGSVTDAEAKVTQEIIDGFKKRDEAIPEFEVKSITATKIYKVI